LSNYEKKYFDLKKLENFAKELCSKLKIGNIVFLKGELGSGKTTFARYLLSNLYKIKNLKPPNSIKSPSFPLLITYDLYDLEVYHYDLYRIKNNAELVELNIEENLKNSITIVEWPERLIQKINHYKYYLIELKIYNENTRLVETNFDLIND